MMYSLYRNREVGRRRVADAALIAAASLDDVKLIRLATDLNKAALIALDGRTTIVKPEAEFDDNLSFMDLYDDCLTHADRERMEEANVSSLDELPEGSCAVWIRLVIPEAAVNVQFSIAAKNRTDTINRIKQLLAEDPLFRDQVFDAICPPTIEREMSRAIP